MACALRETEKRINEKNSKVCIHFTRCIVIRTLNYMLEHLKNRTSRDIRIVKCMLECSNIELDILVEIKIRDIIVPVFRENILLYRLRQAPMALSFHMIVLKHAICIECRSTHEENE